MDKFNIALLPTTKRNFFINLAQNIPMNSAGYQLGFQSIPHITICQFYADKSILDETWLVFCDAWNEQSIFLEFNKFSFITFDNIHYWLSLMPNKLEKLTEIHLKMAEIVMCDKKKQYDPHLTLINTLENDYSKIETLINQYSDISDHFMLALGYCDNLGQFVRIIKQKCIKF